MTQNHPKRLDLQGIRGLAILVAIGFHYYPTIIPNGYLGVDQFFVLSGYLMCMLLKRSVSSQLETCSLITTFYIRRFKRIIPLYYLIILLSIISLYTIFPNTTIGTNKLSAEKALLFISNRAKTYEEDYFKMLKIAEDIFTHTWSLSVEIQFYIIIPLFHSIIKNYSNNINMIVYSAVGVLSFILSISVAPTIAYNSLFCRIWQFCVGIITYLLTICGTDHSDPQLLQEPDCAPSHPKPKNSKTLLLLFLLTLPIVYPIELPAPFIRPWVTILTGLLILISTDNHLLSNRVITYLGDISYALYLIHWPVYAYWKLTINHDFYGPIGISIVMAVMVHELFEKWYLSATNKIITCLTIILFLSSFLIIKMETITLSLSSEKFDPVTSEMTINDAHRYNKWWNNNDRVHLDNPDCIHFNYRWAHLGPWIDFCYHQGTNPNGKYRFAIFGSSWAQNHGRIFHEECAHKAKSIFQGAQAACEPLYPTVFIRNACTHGFHLFEDWLAFDKPDIAFMFTRFFSIGDPMPGNVTRLEDDPVYQTMRSQLPNLLRHIKYKLYILNAVPRANPEELAKLVEYKKGGMSEVDIDRKIVDLSSYEMARKRYKKLIEECGEKCVEIDYLDEFWNNQTGTFRYYDEKGFEYFNIINHITLHGLEKVRHFYRDICSKL